MRSQKDQPSGFTISFRQLLVVMSLILLAISIGSVSYIHKRRNEEILDRAVQSNRESLHAFVTSMDSSLQELESYLFETFRDNPDLNVLIYETNTARRYQAKTAILNLLQQTLRLNGSAQGSFLFLPDSPKTGSLESNSVESDPSKSDLSESSLPGDAPSRDTLAEPIYLARYLNSPRCVADADQIRSDILALTEGGLPGESEGMWSSCVINGEPCMIRMAKAGSAVCGVWVSCASYLQSCSRFLASVDTDSLSFVDNNGNADANTALSVALSGGDARDSTGDNAGNGNDGNVGNSIVSNTGNIAGNRTGNSAEGRSGSTDGTGPDGMINIDIPSQVLPGLVRLSLSEKELLRQAPFRFDYVWYVATILLVMIVIVLVFQFFMYHPIRHLSSEVHALTGREEPEPIHEDYNLKEIAVLSQYINQTIHEMRVMKIRNYEALLSEQQTAQEYLLMRHKTHFFINCISVIHALSNEGNDALISEMAVSLTDYLRKIDYENQEFVRLDDELSLIHSYIHIQEIRFGDSFRFIEEVPIDLFEAQIPPLILQTFVENSVEHARIHEKDNLICLKAAFEAGGEAGQDMLVIDITDNGSGFPEEFRQELENPARVRRLSQGHGVGISNAIARLQHIYQNQAVITISNMAEGGAHVHMRLPVLDQEEAG